MRGLPSTSTCGQQHNWNTGQWLAVTYPSTSWYSIPYLQRSDNNWLPLSHVLQWIALASKVTTFAYRPPRWTRKASCAGGQPQEAVKITNNLSEIKLSTFRDNQQTEQHHKSCIANLNFGRKGKGVFCYQSPYIRWCLEVFTITLWYWNSIFSSSAAAKDNHNTVFLFH